jgi:hypothetical protein
MLGIRHVGSGARSSGNIQWHHWTIHQGFLGSRDCPVVMMQKMEVMVKEGVGRRCHSVIGYLLHLVMRWMTMWMQGEHAVGLVLRVWGIQTGMG